MNRSQFLRALRPSIFLAALLLSACAFGPGADDPDKPGDSFPGQPPPGLTVNCDAVDWSDYLQWLPGVPTQSAPAGAVNNDFDVHRLFLEEDNTGRTQTIEACFSMHVEFLTGVKDLPIPRKGGIYRLPFGKATVMKDADDDSAIHIENAVVRFDMPPTSYFAALVTSDSPPLYQLNDVPNPYNVSGVNVVTDGDAVIQVIEVPEEGEDTYALIASGTFRRFRVGGEDLVIRQIFWSSAECHTKEIRLTPVRIARVIDTPLQDAWALEFAIAGGGHRVLEHVAVGTFLPASPGKVTLQLYEVGSVPTLQFSKEANIRPGDDPSDEKFAYFDLSGLDSTTQARLVSGKTYRLVIESDGPHIPWVTNLVAGEGEWPYPAHNGFYAVMDSFRGSRGDYPTTPNSPAGNPDQRIVPQVVLTSRCAPPQP